MKKYRNYVKRLLLLIIGSSCILSANPFLTEPDRIDVQDLHYNENLKFNWIFKDSFVAVNYGNNKAGLALGFLHKPAVAECAMQYATYRDQDQIMHVYTFGDVEQQTLPSFTMRHRRQHDQDDYYAGRPLIFKDGQLPLSMTIDEMAAYIQHHNVVFYTGAGISIASGVPSMAQLETMLGVDRDHLDDCLLNMMKDPAKIVRGFKQFYEAAFSLEPSPAHTALAALARYKKCAILTENIDLLQHKTGVAPIGDLGASIKTKADSLKEVDAIICIGLSHDDRGFLGLYKEHNLNGLIIAIDLKQPAYLSDNDLLVQGDLQEIVVRLKTIIVGEESNEN